MLYIVRVRCVRELSRQQTPTAIMPSDANPKQANYIRTYVSKMLASYLIIQSHTDKQQCQPDAIHTWNNYPAIYQRNDIEPLAAFWLRMFNN